MPTFEIGATDFLLDGRPHQVISGALHYFRVHPELWADRIRKARLMGLNTIETYVAWNFHAPERGRFDLDGPRDLGRFLDLVAAEGLHAIVRPGPYICAEWDNGGLPAWLSFAYVTTFSMFIGFFFWYRGLALGGVARVGQVQLLQPFLSLLGAALLLGEALTFGNCVFALLVAAVVFSGRRMAVRQQ